MFTVSDLANETQVTTDAVRHYVKLGLLNPRRDSENGYKLFSTNDISRVQFIRNAKSLGFSLKEIAEIFTHSIEGSSPCPGVRETLQQHIEKNRIRLIELNALQERMEKVLGQWRNMPDGIPDGTSVCHLIESLAGDQSG
ncbi:MAG: MerR family transcriptional regulator [Gammaproteobacteria bacterium]|nr:MerR family transcriptional regulator [Gammaproteobacteria bacterium]